MKNSHQYRVELYYTVIDIQLQELNSRFNETNYELLLCVVFLCADDSFATFKKEKLLRFQQYNLLPWTTKWKHRSLTCALVMNSQHSKGLGNLMRRW